MSYLGTVSQIASPLLAQNRSGVNIRPQSTGLLKSLVGGLPYVGGLAQGLINFAQQRKINKEQNVYNRQMADYEFSKNIDAWNLQNKYNAPEEQMKRFTEAGLNKNLMYSQGTSGLAGNISHYQRPQGQFQTEAPLQVLNAIGAYQDYQVKKAQIDNYQANRLNTVAETALKNLNYQYMSQVFNSRLNKEMYQSKQAVHQADIMRINSMNLARRINIEMNKMVSETTKNLESIKLIPQQLKESVAREKFTGTQNEAYNIFKGAGAGSQVLNAILRMFGR